MSSSFPLYLSLCIYICIYMAFLFPPLISFLLFFCSLNNILTTLPIGNIGDTMSVWKYLRVLVMITNIKTLKPFKTLTTTIIIVFVITKYTTLLNKIVLVYEFLLLIFSSPRASLKGRHILLFRSINRLSRDREIIPVILSIYWQNCTQRSIDNNNLSYNIMMNFIRWKRVQVRKWSYTGVLKWQT